MESGSVRMKNKIVFIASYPQSLLNFRLALMLEFITKGYEVIAMAPEDKSVADKLALQQIKYIPIPLERNGLNPFADFKLITQISKIFKNEKPEAIFAYTIKPVIYGSIAAKLAGISKIYSLITGTGYVFLGTNLKSRIVGFIAQSLFRFALSFNTLVFFQNSDNLHFFRKKKLISKQKPAVVINGSGVNCTEFMPTQHPEQIAFLMIARLLYDKGIREYIEAAKLIKKRYPTVKFKLVGWIDTNPNSVTQNELNQWINDGSIEFLGKLSDVRPAITESSVYVLPSYHEGTPRTVLEAMAMGRPIITTDAPGCKETVVSNENGFLIGVKNIQELYQAMEYFILNPEMISTMGQKSRELAISKYEIKKVNQSILQAMDAV